MMCCPLRISPSVLHVVSRPRKNTLDTFSFVLFATNFSPRNDKLERFVTHVLKIYAAGHIQDGKFKSVLQEIDSVFDCLLPAISMRTSCHESSSAMSPPVSGKSRLGVFRCENGRSRSESRVAIQYLH